MKQLLLFIYILGFSFYAQQEAFNPQNSKGSLYEYAEFSNAGRLNFDIHDVISDSHLKYSNLESENHSVGFTSDNYWVRFKLINSSKSPSVYYLETARPITDIVDLYRSSLVKLNENNPRSLDFFTENFKGLIESFQLEIDKEEKSSEIHMLLKI